MNKTLRGTYKELTNYFLREARSCFSSKAYRMAVVAAATSTHLGIYFVLLDAKEFDQDRRLPSFSEVINKAREVGLLKASILDDAEWLMNTRNAFAHPEDWLITESAPIPNNFGVAWFETTFKTKYKLEPKEIEKTKAQAFMACCSNNLRVLREIAEGAIQKTELILMSVHGGYEFGNVEDWKKLVEKQLGGSIDLEAIS